jgi:hypothetical protein
MTALTTHPIMASLRAQQPQVKLVPGKQEQESQPNVGE